MSLRLTLDREKGARESAAADKRAKELEQERERRRLEMEDSLANLEVLKHVEALQQEAERPEPATSATSADEEDFF